MPRAKTARGSKKTAKKAAKKKATKKAAKKVAKKATARPNPYKKLLTETRAEILNLYEHDIRVGQTASDQGAEDLVDRANSAYNREFMFSLSDAERTRLFEIEAALDRLEEGDFGQCHNCGDSIPARRLKAVPWARYCIDCQEKVEQGLVLDVD